MKKLILNYVGKNDWGDNLYKDKEETYFIKDNYNDIMYVGKDYDNDPCGSIKGIDKYKDLEIEIVGEPKEPTAEEEFNYMMLDRLRSDCDYYLGNSGRVRERLWAGDEKGQIEEMKKIYNGFSDDKKPEWLTWDCILKYEKQMVV